MKKYLKISVLCIFVMIMLLSGCNEMRQTIDTKNPVSHETGTDKLPKDASKAKTYILKTDDETALIPNLQLFEDNRFGFSYDSLSSYYPYGTYELKDNKLIARTDDGRYTYVFKVEDNQYIFMQDESSDTSLIDRGVGVRITNGSIFVLKESDLNGMVQMTAIIEEIENDCLLVSSQMDEFPGAYYVYFGDIDVSKLNSGDEVGIAWNGVVLETEPAQIYAAAIVSK